MEGLVTEIGRLFLAHGLLGAVCIIEAFVIVYQYRQHGRSLDSRFSDYERMITAREAVAKALDTNSIALEANNRAMEARTRATEELARQIGDQRRVIELLVQQLTIETSMRGRIDALSRNPNT